MNVTVVNFDSAAFRRALGRFATGVVIITTGGSGQHPVGMTCNSFSSVSLDPPLVQWSIARASRNFELIRAAIYFAVHVLDSSQQQLCRQFAAKDGDRFVNVAVEAGLHGLPLLRDCHARFECEVYARHEAGDHLIVIGRVLRLREQDGQPLIFYGGALGSIAP